MNRRKAIALTVALTSASAFAITNSAQAELGPPAPVAGDVRVTPVNPINPATGLPFPLTADGFSVTGNPLGNTGDGLNQPAPVVALGGSNQKGAGAQIRIHNQWRSGDRVLFQVRDSDGGNCASVPTSVGYSATPTVVSSSAAYQFAGNSPMALNGAPNAVVQADQPVPSTGPQVKPEFQVNLLSSTQCAPNGVKDIVEILFTNQSANPAAVGFNITDAWVLSISGIEYNVGANVTAGPLRNLPLAQDATATPGIFINSPGGWFGGNLAAIGTSPLVQQLWTTTAFVLPVTLTAETPATLVADGFVQNLGSVTLKESTVSSLIPGGNYRLCYSANVGALALPPTTTGPVVAGSVSLTGNCVNFQVSPVGTGGLSATAVDTIVISNLFGAVNTAGATTVSLVEVPALFAADYLTPEDNSVSTSVNSDVNVVAPPYLTAPLAVAAQLPNRIGGANRYETASKIALSLGCNERAVIVNGSSYPDALSATYLAGALGSVFGGDVPILLSSANTLPQATVLALRETGVRSVFIVGGNSVISQQVEDELSSSRRYFCGGDAFDSNQNIVVNRVAGANRYATNNEVIEAVQSIFSGTFNNRLRYQAVPTAPSKRTALVATGENFADALIGGQFAYERFPLILTTGGSLSPEALQSMTSVDIEQVVILGGESAVSAAVATEIEAAGITVIRLAGANRYETGVAVNNWALAATFPGTPSVIAADLPYDLGLGQFVNKPNGQAFLARGDNFADALAAAPIVSQQFGLLALSDQAVLSPATAAWLTSVNPLFRQVTALGLGSAISASTLAAANAAVN